MVRVSRAVRAGKRCIENNMKQHRKLCLDRWPEIKNKKVPEEAINR